MKTSLALLLSSAAVLFQTCQALEFRPRAWKHYRFPPPTLDSWVEILESGDSVVNTSYSGFTATLTPGPRYGSIFRSDTNQQGYLSPLATEGHYALKWTTAASSEISDPSNANFTIKGRMCGGNCAGQALHRSDAPPLPDIDPSGWFVTPHPEIESAWLVKYSENSALYPPPAGAETVYMWAM